MGTRSDIIIETPKGKFARLYCHWDGYLKHNGKILHEHYRDAKKRAALLKNGDLSVLDVEIGEKCPFESRPEGQCLFYKRDRGDKDCEARVFDTLAAAWPGEDTWTEFTYVWRTDDIGQGDWWVASADEGQQALVCLKDALEGTAGVEANVKVPFLGIVGKHA